MRQVRCPEEWKWWKDTGDNLMVHTGERGLFVAGGISNCEDWQTPFINLLEPLNNLAVLNPRRLDFDVNDPSMTKFQIEWEHRHIKNCNGISFWFAPETLCPITLFELGGCLHSYSGVALPQRRIFVGIHPGYKRRYDLEQQIPLANTHRDINEKIEICYSVEALAVQVMDWHLYETENT